MRSQLEQIPVIFRAEKSGIDKGELTAVFPTLPGTNDSASFQVYAHIGQHSSGWSGWYQSTRAATEAESADLLRELRRIYESGPDAVRLIVRRRFSSSYDRTRRAAIAATRESNHA
jgi:hypothetical protein